MRRIGLAIAFALLFAAPAHAAPPAPPVLDSPSYPSVASTVEFAGAGQPGTTITVLDLGQPVASTLVPAGGRWHVTPAHQLPDGRHVFSATATNAAGEVSGESGAVEFMTDTSPPDAPQVTAPAITNSHTVVLTGRTEPDALVNICDLGGVCPPLTQDYARHDGSFAITLVDPVSDGRHEFGVQAVDEAGNFSRQVTVSVVVDTVAPAPPTGTATVDADNVTLTGVAESGATVVIEDADYPVADTTADAAGRWSLTLT